MERQHLPARAMAGLTTLALLVAGLVASLLLAPSATAAPAPDPNLLSNGSFEGAGVSPGATVGWSLSGARSAAWRTSGVVDGSYYADVVPTAASGSIYQDVPVMARAGYTFQATVWVRAGIGVIRPTIALWGNLNGSGRASRAVLVGTGWLKVTLSMQLQAATSTVRLQVFGALNTHVNIDNAILTEQMLTNGGFESAGRNQGPTVAWRNLGSLSAAYLGAVAEGSYFADFVATTRAGGSIYQDVAVTAGVGQIMRLSLWYLAPPGVPVTAAMFANLNPGLAAVRVFVATGGWDQIVLSMPIRTLTSVIRVQVNGAAGQHRYLDGMLLTPSAPAPQTTPAPISTSRYLRDLNGSASDAINMRARGVVDASNNPSNHSYLQLLDIGGQDQPDGGVVLSATSRFVTYAQLVAAVKAYISGYASRQLPGAPAIIAVGTNNDMDVSAVTGSNWADAVIDPLVAYTAAFPGITIAGANDIEPGFSAGPAASRAWLSGYLRATTALFVFNGSADGCSWTSVNGSCNNGWTAADMYWLNAAAAPPRIISLPQIYNTTMPWQWAYISLTGANGGGPRVRFGGPLTEYTACVQAGSCGSLGGYTAWSVLWSAINSNARTAQGSLPYSTDLRIN